MPSVSPDPGPVFEWASIGCRSDSFEDPPPAEQRRIQAAFPGEELIGAERTGARRDAEQ